LSPSPGNKKYQCPLFISCRLSPPTPLPPLTNRIADNAEIFDKIAAMDETQKANIRETKELFESFTAYSKERDMSKNAAMRYADREQELQRKCDITHRKTEVAEGVWSAENREMTCSWNGGTCTHGPNNSFKPP
jgi:predicted O-linked N-acetylglucosamine transferase (SPINDLY family)